MALYLKKGGDSKGLLGLSCRHVLIDSNEPNTVGKASTVRQYKEFSGTDGEFFLDCGDSSAKMRQYYGY